MWTKHSRQNRYRLILCSHYANNPSFLLFIFMFVFFFFSHSFSLVHTFQTILSVLNICMYAYEGLGTKKRLSENLCFISEMATIGLKTEQLRWQGERETDWTFVRFRGYSLWISGFGDPKGNRSLPCHKWHFPEGLIYQFNLSSGIKPFFHKFY